MESIVEYATNQFDIIIAVIGIMAAVIIDCKVTRSNTAAIKANTKISERANVLKEQEISIQKQNTENNKRANELKEQELIVHAQNAENGKHANELKERELKITLLPARRKLLKDLLQLVIFVNNYPPHLMCRWTVKTKYKFDAAQPSFADSDGEQNPTGDYYQYVINEFDEKTADVCIYFPQQVQMYKEVCHWAHVISSSIKYHDNKIKVKSYDMDAANQFKMKFDEFIQAATQNIL